MDINGKYIFAPLEIHSILHILVKYVFCICTVEHQKTVGLCQGLLKLIVKGLRHKNTFQLKEKN